MIVKIDLRLLLRTVRDATFSNQRIALPTVTDGFIPCFDTSEHQMFRQKFYVELEKPIMKLSTAKLRHHQ